MKLVLADDHTLFRDALVQYIVRAEPDARVTLAEDLPGVVDVMKEDPEQDLILLDLRMPGMHGMEGLKRVREEFPDVPVALITGVAEKQDVDEAMSLGAVGYFPKTLSGKALLQAIQSVLNGEKFVPMDNQSNTVMPAYYDDGREQENETTTQKIVNGKDINLTPREIEVLSYLAQGAANKEIANALGLQVVTVKLHVRGICRKLDAKNRTQAAIRARELGLCA